MLTEQTLDKLYAMKLSGMADAFKEQLQQSSLGNLSFEDRFGLLVDRQWTWKEDPKMKRLPEDAKLKINASMEDIDYKSPRGIDRSVMMTLSSCDWIKQYQNVILTGATGAGKTFLACALAQKACRQGYRAFCFRAPKFYYQPAMAKADGSYSRIMYKLNETHLLGIDDLGLAPMTDSERRNLLEIIEDGNSHASTLITSQLPLEHWYENTKIPETQPLLMRSWIASSTTPTEST